MIQKKNSSRTITGGLSTKGITRTRNSNLPLVTIITATYNSGLYLEQSIQSVISQSYPNIEYIIIDGGSEDNTISILKKHNDYIDFWLSEPDNGIYDAWNKALLKTKGDWICFIGSDDFLWGNEVVKKVSHFFDETVSSNSRYLYGRLNYLSPQSLEIMDTIGDPWEVSSKNFFNTMTLSHCGAFHHKSLFEELGSFDTKFKIAGDYAFLLKEFLSGRNPHFIDIVIVGMRSGGISGNLEQRLILAKEMNEARRINGITSISWINSFYIFRARVFLFFYKLLGANLASTLADYYRILLGKGKKWSN